MACLAGHKTKACVRQPRLAVGEMMNDAASSTMAPAKRGKHRANPSSIEYDDHQSTPTSASYHSINATKSNFCSSTIPGIHLLRLLRLAAHSGWRLSVYEGPTESFYVSA